MNKVTFHKIKKNAFLDMIKDSGDNFGSDPYSFVAVSLSLWELGKGLHIRNKHVIMCTPQMLILLLLCSQV